MRRLATSTWLVCISLATLQLSAAAASDLVWEVQNPFRFFKKPAAFALHEKAYDAVRGKPDTPLPANIVWRTERRLNDPDCTDKSSPGRCSTPSARATSDRASAGPRRRSSRSATSATRVRSAITGVCERQYSWGTAKEDYILPDAHTVAVTLSPERLAEAGAGECTFSWLPRARRRQGRDAQAAVQEAIRHQARAVFAGHARSPARPSRSRCPTGASCRDRGGRGRARRRDRRLVHVGREQSGPPGAVQRVARDGLRPDHRQ